MTDPQPATEPALPPHTRLILAHENLLDQWGTRTEDGARITVEWGEPSPEGWYTPTFTVHNDDRLAAQPSAEVERLRAMADEWEQTADRMADRALVGDPGAALAAAATLRDCASTLRAALAESDR